jgi:hypothetical protein
MRPRPKRRRQSFVLEAIEPRLLLSADPGLLNGGVLTGNLTAPNNNVVVALNHTVTPDGVAKDNGLIVDLSVNGVQQTYGDANHGVTSIVLQGNAGDQNDQFTLVDALPINVAIKGGGGVNTIHGPTQGTQWTINGPGSGSINGTTSFTGIENLVGGSGNDVFTVQAGGAISGTIDGGGGADKIVGPNAANTWTITGSDAGTLNGAVNFVSIANLAGGSANNTFRVMAGGSINGSISGGLTSGVAMPSVETLDYSGFGSPVTVNLALGMATAVGANFGINHYIGSGSPLDLLKGPGAQGDSVTWTINGPNAGTVGGVSFSSFANVTGADGTSDTFDVAKGGSLSGTLTGGAGGYNTLEVDRDATMLSQFTATGPGSGVVELDGGRIVYANLQPLTVAGTQVDAVLDLTTGSDQAVLQDYGAPNDGMIELASLNGSFETQIFHVPTHSLTIDLAAGDTLTIGSLDQAFAAALTVNGKSVGGTVNLDGNLNLAGHSLSVSATTINVGNGAVISTRTTAPGADQETAASTGDSGDIHLEAASSSQTFLLGGQTQAINVGTGAKLLAQATDGFKAGAVDLEATTTNFVFNFLLANNLQMIDNASSITIDGATLMGGDVTVAAKAVDFNLLQQLAQALGGNGVIFSGAISGALPLAGGDMLSLPLSVMVRLADADVTLQSATRIVASGDVDVTSEASSNATSEAIYYLATKAFGVQVGASFGFNYAQASAKTIIKDTTLIDTTSMNGGAVTVSATTTNITNGMARVTQNIGAGNSPVALVKGRIAPTDPSSSAFSGVVNVVNATAWAITTQGTDITSAGNVSVKATAKYYDTTNVETAQYYSGAVGITFSLGVANSDVRASVDGTITAETDASQAASADAVALTFDPFTRVDFAAGTLSFVDNNGNPIPHHLATGDAVAYSSDTGTPLPGLADEQTYYVIKVDDYKIRLAATKQDAKNGLYIRFGDYPTLDSGALQRQIVSVDAANNQIVFGAKDGFSTGDRVQYQAVSSKPILGLDDAGGTYYVIATSDTTIRLARTLADATAATPKFIALGIDPGANWVGAQEYPTLQGATTLVITNVDETNSVLVFADNVSAYNGQSFIYNAVPGKRIGGLTPGATYVASVDPASPTQMALIPAGGTTKATLDLNPQFVLASGGVLTPNTFYDQTDELLFNVAPTGVATGDALTYHGALGLTLTGLAEDRTYYAIVNAYDGHRMRLAATAADASAADQAGQQAYNEAYQSFVTRALAGDIDPEYQSAYDAAYQPAFNQAKQNGASDAQAVDAGKNAGATAVANTAAAALGGNWYWAGVADARSGTAPPVGAVSASVAGNELNFGFAHGFQLGDTLVYEGTKTGTLTGLQIGHVYYVVPDASDPNKLSLAETRYAAAARQVVTLGGDPTVQVQFDRVQVFTTEATVQGGNGLELVLDQPFQTGERVVYRGAVGGSITGLTEQNIYFVITDPNDPKHLQLASTYANAIAGTPVALSGPATPVTVFFSQEGQAAVVDSATDTLTTDSGFPYATGDAVIYRGTGGDPPIAELHAGQTYYVVSTAANQIKLALTKADALNGVVIHFATSGETTVWLQTSPDEVQIFQDARPGIVVDFTDNSTVLSGTAHRLDPLVKGISITAKLTAYDSAKTKTGMGSDPKLKDLLTKGELIGSTRNIFANLVGGAGELVTGGSGRDANGDPLKSPVSTAIKKAAPKDDTGKNFKDLPNFQLAGSLSLLITDNHVLAEVGPNAVLRSGGNVNVQADDKHKAAQNVEATNARADEEKPALSFSLGIAVSSYGDSVQALVRGNDSVSSQGTQGPGAIIDAKKALTVAAHMSYPWIFPIQDQSTAAADTEAFFLTNPTARIASFLDGKLGLAGLLFNDWVRTTSKAGAIGDPAKGGAGLAGALALSALFYANTTVAKIESGALINQDVAFRGATGAQTVSVTAGTNYDLVHLTGTFNIDLAPEDGLKVHRNGNIFYGGNSYGTYNPAGAGVGASLHILSIDNLTQAIIEDGAQVYIAKPTVKNANGDITSLGGLVVNADTSILNIAFGFAGAAAASWGVAGAANIDIITSETTAQIGSGAIIRSAPVNDVDVRVTADDTTVMLNVAGAVLSSAGDGAGVGIVVNVLNRDTHAVIGAIGDQTRKTSTLDIGGNVVVDANNDGALIGAALAYASVDPQGEIPPSSGSGSSTVGSSGTSSSKSSLSKVGSFVGSFGTNKDFRSC